MLEPSEKSYCQALQALMRRDYRVAADHFDEAAPYLENNLELELLRAATRLLVTVREELDVPKAADGRIEIEEAFSDG